ncbi:MAG TPA: hypothetical protein VF699_13125, partial [Caulobacteraceae bacterium]
MTVSRATALRSTARAFLLTAAAPGALLMAIAAPAAAQTVVAGGLTNAGTVSDAVVTTPVAPATAGAPTFGGNTVSGGGGTSVITLNDSRTILNWGTGFNLVGGDTLQYQFMVGGNGALVVNRVTGSATINGNLFGCIGACNSPTNPTNIGGNVWFLADSGVIVGGGARIDVGGLLLSSGGITDADVFDGNTNFNITGALTGVDVANGASLRAADGAITLIGNTIAFGGTATSPNGEIALVGAQNVSIGFDADLNPYTTLQINTGSNGTVAGAPLGTAVRVGGAASFSATRTLITAAGIADGQGNILLVDNNAADNVTFLDGDIVLYAARNGGGTVLSGGVVQPIGSFVADEAKVIIRGGLTGPDAVQIRAAGGTGEAGTDLDISAAGNLTIENLAIGRDVALFSDTGTVTTGAITAEDDIVIRANAGLITTGALTTTTIASDDGGTGAADLRNSGQLQGNDVNIAGDGVVTGAVRANVADVQSDAVLDGRAVGVGFGDRDLDVRAGGGVALQGSGGARGIDVALQAVAGTISTNGSITARDDIVLRANGTTGSISIGGGLTSGTTVDTLARTDTAGAGDALVTAAGALTIAGVTFSTLTGHDIDAGGSSITVSGATTAEGLPGSGAAPLESDVRLQATGAVTVQSVTAERDLIIDGGTSTSSTISTTQLAAGRDVAVRATNGHVSIGSSPFPTTVQAGDDILLRSSLTTTVNGALQTQANWTGGTTEEAADAIAAGNAITFGTLVTTLDGSDIDVKAGTDILITGTATAEGYPGSGAKTSDARFQANRNINLATITAERDILIDGTLTTGGFVRVDGDLRAGQDIAIRSSNGSVQVLSGTSVTADDDVAIRASTSVQVTQQIRSGATPGSDVDGAADALARLDPITVAGTPSTTFGAALLVGHDVDVQAGTSISVTGQTTAEGTPGTTPFDSDARFQSGTSLSVAGVTAERDVILDGGTSAGGGVLIAGRDVGVRAANGAVTITSAQAGDDIVLRGSTNVTVNGSLTTTSTVVGTAGEEAADGIFGAAPTALNGNFSITDGNHVDVRATNGFINVTGATNSAGDARFQTVTGTGTTVQTAGVTAGRDILLDGTTATATDLLDAERDI